MQSKTIRLFFGVITIAVLVWAAGSAWHGTRVSKLVPLDPTNGWPRDTFRPWSFFAEAAEIPVGLDTRGSRIDGRVEYTGEFVSGWFRARPAVTLLVAGFPHQPGNGLAVDVRSTTDQRVITFDDVDPRDCWRPWRISLPSGAVTFRVRAVDGSTGENGWLAVTEPFETSLRPDLLPQVPRALLTFCIDALLFSVVGMASLRVLGRWVDQSISPALLVALGASAVALLGYVAFWIYFAHPAAGRVFSWTILIVSAVSLICKMPTREAAPPRTRSLLALVFVIGLFYLALLMVFQPPRLSFAAANRFDQGLPSDNEIPRAFAERLWKGESPRHLWGDWLSSDRPPLQAGWQLMTWPILHALHVDLDTAANVSGLWFQLLWVPAVCALAMSFGLTLRQALGVTAAVACCGVLLEYSVFVWPKLGAAALVLTAYLVWFEAAAWSIQRRCAVGGALAALGWLAHGGVAFSLLAIAPLAVARRPAISLRHWLFAGLAFAVCASPWMAYQHWYDPPGNRLLKMHLAGSPELDARGFLATLRQSYATAGLAAWRSKWVNLRVQFSGNWNELAQLRASSGWLSLRATETAFLVRACDWWLVALIAPLLWFVRRETGPPQAVRREMIRALTWMGLGVFIWLALMFTPGAATIHQGSVVTQLLCFTLLAVAARYVSPVLFVTLALVQMAWFGVARGCRSCRLRQSRFPA